MASAPLALVTLGSWSACATAGDSTGGPGGDAGTAGGGGAILDYDGGDAGPLEDPKTCEEAAANRSYTGCDFWPTVLQNPVWSVFDFAVVVANAAPETIVGVTVSRGDTVVAQAQIAPNALQTIYLPWVTQLKGGDCDECGSGPTGVQSKLVLNGSYHLVTTHPVTVYQFNALEYYGQGGPPGKDWSTCPANQGCTAGCFSFSNDASLLLPTTALTTNYRVTSMGGSETSSMGTNYVAVTGTANDTAVTVHVSATGKISAGIDISSAGPGETTEFVLQAGDVAVLGTSVQGSDLSGSLVTADKPVQVLAGMPCTNMPNGAPACDHIEESVFPAETLGQHYFVTRPSGPNGTVANHVVRLYGNVNGTELSYPSGKPPTAPAAIDAGEVVDLGVVDMEFEVVGTHEFAVGMFMLGGSIVDPLAPAGQQKGDPSQTLATPVEQFRKKYVFLAPVDYDTSFVDVIQPLATKVNLDGQELMFGPMAIGASGYGVTRLNLSFHPGGYGAHVLLASDPVGIQVAGYGAYTSYHYPGGLNLERIAPPPLE
jgi:hypothetical protein